MESAKSPKAPEDSEKIAVDHLEPELIEFEGFINYGTPIEVQAVNDLGLPEGIVITESRIEMPVFTARSNKSKRAEQDGAEQPATAPESKPESNEKPQPDSEGRSQ